MSITITQRKVDELIPYARNSRTHSDEQVAQIAASIKEFGWTNPILIDGEGVIIAGHGRLLAARKLGYEEVPTIELRDLTEAQKKAYVIADNRLALNAGWDNEMLTLELGELAAEGYNLDLLGFDTKELDALLEPQVIDGLVDEDEVPEAGPEPITKPGDIWVLGRHRLVCGDSTSIDAIDQLLDGEKVDMVFTDPPYNIDYQGVSDRRKIKNDKMSDSSFVDFLVNSITSCERCRWEIYWWRRCTKSSARCSNDCADGGNTHNSDGCCGQLPTRTCYWIRSQHIRCCWNCIQDDMG